jgi:hypothetical protein
MNLFVSKFFKILIYNLFTKKMIDSVFGVHYSQWIVHYYDFCVLIICNSDLCCFDDNEKNNYLLVFTHILVIFSNILLLLL